MKKNITEQFKNEVLDVLNTNTDGMIKGFFENYFDESNISVDTESCWVDLKAINFTITFGYNGTFIQFIDKFDSVDCSFELDEITTIKEVMECSNEVMDIYSKYFAE